uniref:Telomere_reg-2 domain-containing protein n=1 Tax=Parastrongyloides trichosuri TaxID=131310 RepID=A0A0N4ZUU2_PARTI
MPDFVTVIQLLNVVSALKLMIRNMTECEKNCIKSRIENFLINCFNSLYSAEEARKQIMWHFIEWYKNEVKCYEDKFKNIKDFQEEGMIKSWELEFLEHIFDEPDIIISPPNKEIIVEQQNVTPETYEEIDSDDDLPQFLKSTCILKQETKSNDLDSDDEVEEKYKEFYYIMDCINELSSTENRLVFIGGIKSLDKLMKKKSLGYKEFSSIIIEMFLKIREDFYFEEFEEHRRSILVTTLFHNPNLIISFIESTTTKNMSDFERLLRLDIINLTCAKLKKEDSQTFHLLISDIIFSLSFAFNVNSALSSEIDKNQTTFIKIILTIGDLLRLAENTPQIVLINSKIFRILKLIRSYKNHIFVTACMEVYIIITKSCEKSILIDNFSGELKEIQGWIINLTNSVNSIMNDEKSMTKMDKFTQYDYASNLLSNIQSILCFK